MSATHVISETLFSILLTAHALLAASSFTLPPPSVCAGLFHVILCDAKQDHTTMSGECRWGGLAMLGVRAGAIARYGAQEAQACVTER